MIRRPPRATQSRSSAASDVCKRQVIADGEIGAADIVVDGSGQSHTADAVLLMKIELSLIHISEPTRPY